MLLGLDVDGVLDGVGSNNNAVIGLGVRGVDLALEKAADGHLGDRLLASLLILVDLVDADIVLAIAGSRKAGHRVVDCGVFYLACVEAYRLERKPRLGVDKNGAGMVRSGNGNEDGRFGYAMTRSCERNLGQASLASKPRLSLCGDVDIVCS